MHAFDYDEKKLKRFYTRLYVFEKGLKPMKTYTLYFSLNVNPGRKRM